MTDFSNINLIDEIDDSVNVSSTGREKSQPQTKYWCYTLNNHSSVNVPRTFFPNETDYHIWSEEDAGTPHLQGYLCLTKKKRLSQMKKVNQEAHWEPRKYSHVAARDYCKKSDSHVSGPYIIGDETDLQKPGRRNDLIAFRDAIQEGQSDKTIIQDNALASTWLKYNVAAARMRTALGVNVRMHQTQCIIFYGPPGTGKSFAARKFCSDNNLTYHVLPQKQATDSNPWFDGWQGQDVLIIDEMNGHVMKPNLFCELIDSTHVQVPVKQNHVDFNARYVIFTSNRDPYQWWSEQVIKSNPGVIRRLDAATKRYYSEVFVPPVVINDPLIAAYAFGGTAMQHDAALPASYVDTAYGSHRSDYVPSWVTDEEHRETIDLSDESFGSIGSKTKNTFGVPITIWQDQQAYMRQHGHVAPLPNEPPCVREHTKEVNRQKPVDQHKERMIMLQKKQQTALK